MDISERSFEEAIECGLLQHGPDACAGDAGAFREALAPYGDSLPGGYRKHRPEEYDRALCLLPRDVVDFVLATQPKEWKRLEEHHGGAVREQFLRRLASGIERRGALDVLRQGIRDSGCKFSLAYFRPASGLNEETRRLHAANLFAIVRQLRYGATGGKSLDLVLFLNGIPIFTAELKNPLTGQDVEDAIRQYMTDRDPREPLLAYGRCLAHFAVDPNLVYVTTHLDRGRTRFLPFNQGRFGGAGNPPVPPTRAGYSTGYLWEETWTRDSVLDLVRQFIHEVEEEDDRGRKTGRRFLIFPRYQQLDAVRRLVAHAREHSTGQRYLIQHSAGSGKSFTIAWLAHRLATLHDAADRRVFDSIVVITDRRILDRQIQTTMRQFEQTLGVVENIDTTSRQLKQALESGKTIIVTTLQKFPVIVREIGELPGHRFAVIVDEAHSSQSGESTKSLKSVLAAGTLEEAEREEAGAETPEEELESAILAEMQKRGRVRNISTFAFTATPKPKTLELFGRRRDDGKFEPFHLYSMRQAIEEKFILDVLATYTTYTAYWRLLKTVEDDPRYDRRKAQYLLRSFVELHPHAINEKVRIMVEHFAAQVQHQVGGKAKAMIVTCSRLHAVRYRLAVDRYLAERVLDFANEADVIRAAFEPYFETTGLSEATDPNLLYEIQSRLLAFPVYTDADVQAFTRVYVDKTSTQDRLYSALAPAVARAGDLAEAERLDFRGQLTDYVRLYSFLGQILAFVDTDLEKLYVFARYLRRLLPADPLTLPREVQQNIDMESYRIRQTSTGGITLERNAGVLKPIATKSRRAAGTEEIEPLSRIIAELNERFGLQVGPEHRVTLGQMIEKLDTDAALDASARVNTRENVRLTFDQKVEHVIQEIVDSNFDLYKRITDDRTFGETVKDLLFDHYLRAHRQAEELIKRGESKTLEFKATLRWNVREDRQDDKVVTHSALKTIAAFLNTEGGDLLIGVADEGAIVGIDVDRLDTDDRFMLHLAQVVRNGLGDRASTCIDPRTQIVEGKTVCLKWKGLETAAGGDFYVRSGPGSVRLPPDSAAEYIRTRFPATRPES